MLQDDRLGWQGAGQVLRRLRHQEPVFHGIMPHLRVRLWGGKGQECLGRLHLSQQLLAASFVRYVFWHYIEASQGTRVCFQVGVVETETRLIARIPPWHAECVGNG
jgi:hypothetical protein